MLRVVQYEGRARRIHRLDFFEDLLDQSRRSGRIIRNRQELRFNLEGHDINRKKTRPASTGKECGIVTIRSREVMVREGKAR